MRRLQALRPREASIFAAFTDSVVAPRPPFPPVCETDAAFALDENLHAAPAANRLGLRAALLALELAPLAIGQRRLRRLEPEARSAVLQRLEHGPLTGLMKALRSLAHLNYYGDPAVMRLMGYDADAVIGRAAALRQAERRW